MRVLELGSLFLETSFRRLRTRERSLCHVHCVKGTPPTHKVRKLCGCWQKTLRNPREESRLGAGKSCEITHAGVIFKARMRELTSYARDTARGIATAREKALWKGTAVAGVTVGKETVVGLRTELFVVTTFGSGFGWFVLRETWSLWGGTSILQSSCYDFAVDVGNPRPYSESATSANKNSRLENRPMQVFVVRFDVRRGRGCVMLSKTDYSIFLVGSFSCSSTYPKMMGWSCWDLYRLLFEV